MRNPLQTGNGSPNPAAGGELAGPGAEAWLTLGVRLESLTAELEENNRRLRKLWQSVHRVQITGPALPVTANAWVQSPKLLGPTRGWFWDVRRLSFFNAGSSLSSAMLIVWKNDRVPNQFVDYFLAPNYSHTYGKAQLLLGPGDHLVYGWPPTGTVTLPATPMMIGGEAIQVSEECLPMYLT